MALQKAPLRLLARCHQLRPSGAPIMLFSLLERLVQRHRVTMLVSDTPDPAFVERYRDIGVTLADGAHLGEYDVFLVNTLLGAPWILQAKDRVPTAWWIHEAAFGLGFIKAGAADEAAFEAATRVIFPSDWQSRELFRPWLAKASWSVVPTAIPPVPRLERRRGDDGRFRLLHIGLVESRKGQDLTIKALLELKDPSLELRFVGPDHGKWAGQVKRSIARFPRTARQITWCGQLSPEQVQQEIADADALVFPSRDDLFALVVLEAMSHGVPVICSRYGALADGLVHCEEALLVTPDDPTSLARAIRQLQQEPGLRKRLVKNARTRVLSKRTYDDFVAAMEAELYAAIDDFQRGATA